MAGSATITPVIWEKLGVPVMGRQVRLKVGFRANGLHDMLTA